jgi:hypothetical protein
MNAIEFQATVKNGVIEIPPEHAKNLAERVRVILLVENAPQSTTNLIDELITRPVRVKGFRPLSREDAHAR